MFRKLAAAARAVLRPAVVVWLSCHAVHAEISCFPKTIDKPSTIQQLQQTLSNPGLGLLGEGIAIVGKYNGNARVEAVGEAVKLVQKLFQYLQSQPGMKSTLLVCSAPPSVAAPVGLPSLNFVGTQQDMSGLVIGREALQQPLEDLLRPYRIPTFSATGAQPTFRGRLADAGANFVTISGKVLDESGRELPGAIVTLIQTGLAASAPQSRITLLDGTFQFLTTSGTHVVSARLDGYHTATQELGGLSLLRSLPVTLVLQREAQSRCSFTIFNRTQFDIQLWTDAVPPSAIIGANSYLTIELTRPTKLRGQGRYVNASWPERQVACGGTGWIEMTP